MAELRAFIDRLRSEYGIPYPLADRRPFVADKQLVHEVQEAANLDAEFCLVAEVRGQLVRTPPSADFFHRVTWEGDEATVWRPHDVPESPVRIDPELRFEKPTVRGVSTETIWGHLDGGESETEIAETFGLSLADVG